MKKLISFFIGFLIILAAYYFLIMAIVLEQERVEQERLRIQEQYIWE